MPTREVDQKAKLNTWMNHFLYKLQLGSPVTMGALTGDMIDAMRYAMEGAMFAPEQIHVDKGTFEGLSKMLKNSKSKKK